MKPKKILYKFKIYSFEISFIVISYLLAYLMNHFEIIMYDDLNNQIKEIYLSYGLIILFVVSLIEGFLFLGFYFPGSLVVVYGVILADGEFSQIMGIIFVVWLAISINSFINFYLGRKSQNISFFKRLGEKKLSKQKYKFQFFIHPTLVAYYSYMMGVQNKPSEFPIIIFYTFLSGCIYSILITAFTKLF